MKTFYVFLAVVFPIASFAQLGRDSVLLNERTMDRPITLHGGQLRLSGGYALGVNNRRYDNAGKSIDLSKDGLSSVVNTLAFELKYGISEHFQFTLAFSGLNQGVREQSSYVIVTSEPSIDISSIHTYKGWQDPLIALDYRAPFKTRKFDWSVSGGMTLPLGRAGEARPTHTFTPGADFNTIVYHYNYNVGYGVSMVQAGTLFKYRATNVAFSFTGSYRMPTGEQDLSSWSSQMNGSAFEYREQKYRYLRSNEILGSGEFEYQMFPWFDILAAVTYKSSTGGWSLESGAKVPNPTSYLTYLSPGFEIIVTPKFWLRQRVSFPVSGNDADATLIFSSTLSYNFFPINK